MDQNRSNIAWLMAESKTLALCGRQAWTMVPKWHRGALALASGLMAANSVSYTVQTFLIGAIVNLLTSAAKIGIFAEFNPDLQPAVNAAAKAAAIANNAPAQTQLMWDAGKLLGIIGVLYLMRETFNVLRRYLVENTCAGLNRDMQMRVAAHVMRYDMQQLNSQKLGSMHGRIVRSVDGLIQFIRLMFLDFLPAILSGVCALVAVVFAQPIMGAVMLGVVPISVFLTLQQLKSQKGVRLNLMRDAEEVDGMLIEQMAGVEYIRVANTLDREAERLSVTTDRRRKRELKHHFEMSLFGSGKAINEGIFNLLVLAVATYLVIDGQMQIGGIYVFMGLFLQVMTPLSEIHRIIDLGHESSLKMQDLKELLDRPIDESFDTPSIGNIVGLAAREPEIEVEEASAIYRSGDRVKQVLFDVSFKVHQGEVIGIAGQSGGGKSSMIKLLLRLLHPTHGTIKLHGIPIDLMDRASLANLVGYVGQNPFVFSGTVRDNIAYGCGDVSDEEVKRAAEGAHIHDEILAMHDGYNTPVSERGSNLSGGQRQRLAIARLLLRDTPILILDEATSALDNISERSIQGSLGIRSGKQTILMIAHRLTTLRHCDKILVFDDGRIVESGTFENLSQANGKFAELLRASESEIEAIAS